MACSLQLLVLFLSFVSIFHVYFALILHVTKDVSTLQYTSTKIHHGTSLVPIKLVVDLNGPFIWTDCSSRYVSESHLLPISYRSLQCSTVKAHGPRSRPDPGPGPGNVTCGVSLENPITKMTIWGDLVEDIVAVNHVYQSKIGSISTVHRLLQYCTPTIFLNGLASGTNGVLGLGRTRMAFQSQVAMSYNLDRKFAICLSSSRGIINFGHGPYLSTSKINFVKSLIYTPLVTYNNGDGDGVEDYFINVKSIQINGKPILFPMDRRKQGVLTTKISTIVPYTTMESSIFDTFTKIYIELATSMNMSRVTSPVAAPFKVCFSSKNIGNTPVGPAVPTIDLMLQSEMVKWRIYGKNAMVRVNDEVMCFGFLDGGSNQKISIVIGGYQLEDNFLQFDLATSMLGFSSSLFAKGLTCSMLENLSIHKVSSY